MPKPSAYQKNIFFQGASFGNVNQVRGGLAIEPKWAKALDPMGFSALAHSAVHGHADCVRELLPVSDLSIRVGVGKTLLILAAASGSADCVSLLLPWSDPNATDHNGISALMSAAGADSMECVKALLPQCDILQKDHEGKTAADWARECGHKKCADFLGFCVANAERTVLSETAEAGQSKAPSELTGPARPAMRI